jgi:hypothetical protein
LKFILQRHKKSPLFQEKIVGHHRREQWTDKSMTQWRDYRIIHGDRLNKHFALTAREVRIPPSSPNPNEQNDDREEKYSHDGANNRRHPNNRIPRGTNRFNRSVFTNQEVGKFYD